MKRFAAICLVILVVGLFVYLDSRTVREILHDISNDSERLRKQQQEDNALKRLEKRDSLSRNK